MKNDEELFYDFCKTRNLKLSTSKTYRFYINLYTKFNEKSMVELIQEAEDEEEQGIRWKHRTLKKRLIEFRAYLFKNYLKSSSIETFNKILTFYKHYEIEIHDLPSYSIKNVNQNKPITFKDLPDKEVITASLGIASPFMRAIILFISSSGCARVETLNFTIQDFINATRQYHNKNDIYDVLNELKDKTDIVPAWELRRPKTGKFYITFNSPEATAELVNYLISSNRVLKNDDKLFKVHPDHLNHLFQNINDKLNLGKRGTYNRFRMHMLRKYHASQLFNDGCSMDFVDALQGRGKDATHSSYFMENPETLKEEYINHLDCLMINWDSVTYKSPEFIELEEENRSKSKELSELGNRVKNMEELIYDGVDKEKLDRLRRLLSK